MTTMMRIVFTVVVFAVVVHGSDDIDCNDGGFYIKADPRSTKHFYKCDNGKPVRFKCPDGLIYNRELCVCDWPKNAEKGASGHSKPSSITGQQYNGNNGKPTTGSNNKKPANNEVQFAGNSKKPSNSGNQQSNKPTDLNTAKPSGSGTTGTGSEIPWHYQSYSTDDDEDMYAVQIIDNNLDLGGLGYKKQ